MQNIYSFTKEELESFLVKNSYKKYRAPQIFDWLYQKQINNIDEMTNLNEEVKTFLKQNTKINTIVVLKIEKDKDTIKFLLKLHDNQMVEAVLMKHDYGNSVCLSTQVGCNFGCTFCESGKLKKIRNLDAGEMVETIILIQDEIKERISHVVLMGIGEPLDNYEQVVKFIDIINEPKGLAIGARHITVSTSGVIPKIKEFMNLEKQINLAISLHAPNNKLRTSLMPINKTYPLDELIKVLKEYINKTNRRITFEYILLDNINDQEKHALELSELIKGMNAYVNLIPYNPTSSLYKASSKEQILKFYDILKKNKINVTIRKEMGTKIKAACGQLVSHEGGNK